MSKTTASLRSPVAVVANDERMSIDSRYRLLDEFDLLTFAIL
jgi:hypothetical protein